MYVYSMKSVGGILFVSVEGEISSIGELNDLNKIVFDEMDELGLEKAVRDYRRVNWGDIDFFDVIQLMEVMLEETDRNHLRATVSVFTEKGMQIGRMFETASVNRSINYRSFFDRDEALSWLDSVCLEGKAGLGSMKGMFLSGPR